uniref:Uncharacterized protein n=1 Tax=Mimiviridae sp. ChoanoV1 TaxID=2596887 RepID=A0A5B8IFC7_9VIRU|nr:hypothetical protein 3_87 [Mimiviridae sp. ChoanoV1]
MNTIEFANMDFITEASKSYDSKIPFYLHLINCGLNKQKAKDLINVFKSKYPNVKKNTNINLYEYNPNYIFDWLNMALHKLELDEKYDSMMATLVTV